MKLFQQLLVAPAALGLLSPVVAQASELNIDGINAYASDEQVTSVNQLSDVKPTDWAYQALSNLIERYGCVAGYPNGTYKGGQAMTRFEAAALLNACLDRITEITDELKRLMAEFEKELAILRGRVDGLEAKVGELEASQFSTTTKLNGKATFVLGANSYSGDALVGSRAANFLGVNVPGVNTPLPTPFGPVFSAPINPLTPGFLGIPGPGRVPAVTLTDTNSVGQLPGPNGAPGTPGSTPPFLPGTIFPPNVAENSWSQLAGSRQGGTTFSYQVELIFDTSFTGKDLLRTRLEAGNFNNSAFGGDAPIVNLSALEVAFETPPANDVVAIERLYYQFPIGSNVTATIGGRVRQDEMLAMWPSAYPADTVLDVFTYAGAPGTYSLNLGAGGGLWWKSGKWSLSANYVSANADNSNPDTNFAGTVTGCGGIGTDCAAQTGTFQLAYSGANWGIAGAYTYTQANGIAGLYGGNATPLASALSALADSTNSVGVSAYWQPTNSGWIPSFSVGWGINTNQYERGLRDIFNPGGAQAQFTNNLISNGSISSSTTQSWYVGLQWDDVLIKGNALGMAVGQATFLTGVQSNNPVGFQPAQNAIVDGNYAWEWWYKFQVTDNISVTPALFYLSNPVGQLSKNVGAYNANVGRDFNNFGGLIKTTFKF